jgi:hypothetical protein
MGSQMVRATTQRCKICLLNNNSKHGLEKVEVRTPAMSLNRRQIRKSLCPLQQQMDAFSSFKIGKCAKAVGQRTVCLRVWCPLPAGSGLWWFTPLQTAERSWQYLMPLSINDALNCRLVPRPASLPTPIDSEGAVAGYLQNWVADPLTMLASRVPGGERALWIPVPPKVLLQDAVIRKVGAGL